MLFFYFGCYFLTIFFELPLTSWLYLPAIKHALSSKTPSPSPFSPSFCPARVISRANLLMFSAHSLFTWVRLHVSHQCILLCAYYHLPASALLHMDDLWDSPKHKISRHQLYSACGSLSKRTHRNIVNRNEWRFNPFYSVFL